ncbi:ankyrin repeat protein [Yasminevirus sp. GU-2018]|uniref:Ankyrin repeat protein n=1 Tax=Yasminevirus sp. GU-2018 TaxID=2420051 RepID=A0A5K0U882_9VIRU|nr:ankyrin repeat protein [Yasminevirus sp. GU-2018]
MSKESVKHKHHKSLKTKHRDSSTEYSSELTIDSNNAVEVSNVNNLNNTNTNNDTNALVQHMTNYEFEKNKLVTLIELGKWDEILAYLPKLTTFNINVPIINGNNLFHMACIKGESEFIKKLLDMEEQIKLNVNMFNSDGLTGAHLYYKYGGLEPLFLGEKDICYVDDNNYVLAMKFIDKIEFLEFFIDTMIDYDCIENIGLRNDNHIFFSIMTKINYYATFDTATSARYVKSLDKLYKVLKPSNFVFLAIQINCIEALKVLMQHRYDFNTYSAGNLTPIGKCIDKNRIEMMVMILAYTKTKFGDTAVFKLVNSADVDYDMRPIMIAIEEDNVIALRILTEYIQDYFSKQDIKKEGKQLLEYTDSGHNTYLHRLLVMKNLSDVPHDIIKFFIDHGDLNKENYAGVTPAHLLFGKGIWKNYQNILVGREIDLLKVDDLGNNCYSYVKTEEKAEFMSFVEKIKLPIKQQNSKDVDRLFDVDTVKQLLKPSSKDSQNNSKFLPTSNPSKKQQKANKQKYEFVLDEKIQNTTTTEVTNTNVGVASIDNVKGKNYGLFNANLPHYMLYLRYLENKYSNMYVPVQEYDTKKVENDMFFFNTVSTYVTSSEQSMIVRHVRLYQLLFYSYLPHNIYWLDSDCYYIHPNLKKLLTHHNFTVDVTKQRYVMLKLSVIVTENLLHANVLMYDRLNREAWRFEPYGTTRVTHKEPMDSKLRELLQSVYGEITYYEPDDFLSGLNFQMVDGENFTVTKNLGDPGGYCLAWSLWFIDIVLTHPDLNVKYIMHNFFKRNEISSILSDEEGEKIESTNYYLDFIRRYAHKLDNEKNTLLLDMGVKKYYLYNTVFKDNVLKLIENMFKKSPNILPLSDERRYQAVKSKNEIDDNIESIENVSTTSTVLSDSSISSDSEDY